MLLFKSAEKRAGKSPLSYPNYCSRNAQAVESVDHQKVVLNMLGVEGDAMVQCVVSSFALDGGEEKKDGQKRKPDYDYSSCPVISE